MVAEEEGKKRWEERRSRRRCSNGFLGMVLEREREREREREGSLGGVKARRKVVR